MSQELPFSLNIALMCVALYVLFRIDVLGGIMIMYGIMFINAIMWRYGTPMG